VGCRIRNLSFYLHSLTTVASSVPLVEGSRDGDNQFVVSRPSTTVTLEYGRLVQVFPGVEDDVLTQTDVEPSRTTVVGDSGFEDVGVSLGFEGRSVSGAGGQNGNGGNERREFGEAEHSDGEGVL
jgi:hypothetical protein